MTSDAMSSPMGTLKDAQKPAESERRLRIPYDDLRQWIAEAQRLGEVRVVSGASWQQEIGMAAELALHADSAPCLIFDEVPGCEKGHRVLTNFFGGKRKNMTLGSPFEPLGDERPVLFAPVPAVPARAAHLGMQAGGQFGQPSVVESALGLTGR